MLKGTRISTLRATVQLLAFIVLIYAGFIITIRHVDSGWMPFIKPPADKSVKLPNLEPATGYDQVFDSYAPFRTCRYISSETRVFRACSMHFMTEIPIYGVPLKDALPHIVLFIVLAFLLSRMMCGWLCPLGAMQDFLSWLREKLGLGRLRLPRRFLDWFGTFRYAWLIFLFIMAVAIVIPALGLVPLQRDLNVLTCNTCPGRLMYPLLTLQGPGLWLFDSPLHAAISLVGVFFVMLFFLSFFGKRLWCRVCPTGALLSVFNMGGALVKEKDSRKCTKCGVCERVCPMDNKKVFAMKKKKIVNDFNCINCFKCIDKCPEEGALKVKFFGWEWFRSKRR
jgi:ferredoxin-type protein NapH